MRDRVSPARGAAYGLAAAGLFGASPPLSKLLLPQMHLLLLSAFLYLGAGLAVSLARAIRSGQRAAREAQLRGTDLPALVGVVFFGGLVGPILMLLGLERVSGVVGALLLNLETPFTVLLAVVFLREHLGLRAGLASVTILVGAALLAYRGGALHGSFLGTLALAGACFAWAIDNNLSQRLSARDPLAVVQVKALAAGSCALVIALLSGATLPASKFAAGALALGSLSYGASLVLNMRALREIGAARQAVLFATAPFIGALLSIPVLSERPRPLHAVAAVLMAAGVAALLREQHTHIHTHEPMEHDHLHVHDDHHQHEHEGPVTEPHSHPHRHEGPMHEHPHAPDLHHRHPHR